MDKRPIDGARLLKRLNLPKAPVNKADEANQFLQDPVHVQMAEQPAIQKHNHNRGNSHKRVKRNRDKIKQTLRQIDSQSLMQQQRAIVRRMMKKYQPSNSSFSLLYGQKINMISRPRHIQSFFNQKIKISEFDTINKNSYKKLPGLSRVINPKYQKIKAKSTKNFDVIHVPSTQRIQSINYFKKLKQIRQQSKLLRDQSQFLLHKTSSTQKYIQKKFNKLDQHSNQLLSGSKIYRLQQQMNQSYKNRL